MRDDFRQPPAQPSVRPSGSSSSPIPSHEDGEIFRREALDAWRRGLENSGAELELAPAWTRWAFPAVLLLATGIVLFAALSEAPIQITGPAVVRATSRDSLIVEAYLPVRDRHEIEPGMRSFFTTEGADPIPLTVLSAVARDESLEQPGAKRVGSTHSPVAVVLAGRPQRRRDGSTPADAALVGTSGTARVVLGKESLLRMLRLANVRGRAAR